MPHMCAYGGESCAEHNPHPQQRLGQDWKGEGQKCFLFKTCHLSGLKGGLPAGRVGAGC